MKKGSHLTSEHRAKISATLKGRPGYIPSQETRAKISAAHMGEKSNRWGIPHTIATRAKISAAHIGKKFTPEHRTKISTALSGEKSYQWKGGRYKNDGYERIYVRPHFYLSVHRLNMAQTLGRKLQKGEVVHHINRKRLDNRKENLALCSNQAAHLWAHTEEAKVFLGA